MHFLSHLSYPYLVANLVAMLMGKSISLEYNLIILFFSVFPDIDIAIDFIIQIIKTKTYVIPANHHNLPTHWPIVYSPLIILSSITIEPFFIIATLAVYTHLIMDMFYCNEGVMFFYPFSKKWHNFLSKKTVYQQGWNWNKAYSKLKIALVDRVAFLIVVLHMFLR